MAVKASVDTQNQTIVRVGQQNAIRVSSTSAEISSADTATNALNVIGGRADVTQLAVSGLSTFTGIVTTASDLYVGGDLYLNDDLVLDNITGNSLIISGISTFVGLSTFNDGLIIHSGFSTFHDDVIFKGNTSNAKWDSSTNDLILFDNTRLEFGSNKDFEIWHGGSHTFMKNSGGDLRIRGDKILLKRADDTERYLEANVNNEVKLFFNGDEKFATTLQGVEIGTVAISTVGFITATDVWVSGAVTATSFYGSGANLNSIPNSALDNNSVSYGGVEVSLGSNDDTPAFNLVDAYLEWTLGVNGNDYTFTGPGLTGVEYDPTLYLKRGQKYRFKNASGGHPFRIQYTGNDTNGIAYDDGITNNPADDGTTLQWHVQFDAPDVLYYQCTQHTNMSGKIYIDNVDPDYSTIGDLNVTGISTLGIATATSLYVSGISTFAGITIVDGDTLFTKELIVSGVGDVAGISTLGIASATSLYVSGIITATKFYGDGTNLIGVARTDNINADSLYVSGISTFAGITTVTGDTLFTKQLSVSGLSTYIGVATYKSNVFIDGTLTAGAIDGGTY